MTFARADGGCRLLHFRWSSRTGRKRQGRPGIRTTYIFGHSLPVKKKTSPLWA